MFASKQEEIDAYTKKKEDKLNYLKSQIKSNKRKIEETKKGIQNRKRDISDLKSQIHELKLDIEQKRKQVNVSGYTAYILNSYIIPFFTKVMGGIKSLYLLQYYFICRWTVLCSWFKDFKTTLYIKYLEISLWLEQFDFILEWKLQFRTFMKHTRQLYYFRVVLTI